MDSQPRSHHEPFLLPLYPRFICHAMMSQGLSENDIFKGLEFSLRELETESFRLTIDQHERLILRLIQLSGDDHLALRLNPQHESAGTNLTILAIANSGRISRALDAIARYFKNITRVFSINHLTGHDRAGMEMEVHLENQKVIFFALTSFALFLDAFFARAVAGGHIVRRLELPGDAPLNMEQVAGEYPFELVFSTDHTRVYFNQDLLDAPMPGGDPQTMRLLVDVCERQLREAEAETSFVGRVKWLVINRVASPPKLDDAARLLGISSRGLRRRLAGAGTSYQRLVDEMRYQTASRLLRQSSVPVSAIAYELGYGSPSDFSRAFRKWAGTTPSEFRDRHR